MAPIPNVTFNNGLTIPILGLGTYKSETGQVGQAVKDAISAGYRHIDCAHLYGNEQEVGEGIKAKIDDETIKREDIFVTSKLWVNSFEKDLVIPTLKNTLKTLGVDYVDLYLIHWPCGLKSGDAFVPTGEDGKIIFNDVHYTEVWKGMEDAHKAGLTKSIGVSNFNKRQLGDILKMATVKPVTNQVECHPFHSQKKLIEYCKENDIVVTGYSPLGSPDRLNVLAEHPVLLENETLAEIAKKHNKNPGQILIKYQIQNGRVVIPKSVTKSRIESNFNVFDFEMSDEEMQSIEDLNQNLRLFAFDMIDHHPEYPFSPRDEY